jgi:hypothetical protein
LPKPTVEQLIRWSSQPSTWCQQLQALARLRSRSCVIDRIDLHRDPLEVRKATISVKVAPFKEQIEAVRQVRRVLPGVAVELPPDRCGYSIPLGSLT